VDPKTAAAVKVEQADRALKGSKAGRTDPGRLLQSILEGQPVHVPLNSDLHAVAKLFERANPDQPVTYPIRPDLAAFRRLILVCLEETDLLGGRGAPQFARALLALSAHAGRWVREPEGWEPRSHNAYRQFHSLVRHLTARYEVPTFLNTAWLEGLTPKGVVHQRWFLHVAQGQNIRTAVGLPVPLSKRQAHLYLQAPDDFDVLTAIRWAQVLDLAGTSGWSGRSWRPASARSSGTTSSGSRCSAGWSPSRCSTGFTTVPLSITCTTGSSSPRCPTRMQPCPVSRSSCPRSRISR